MCRRFLSLYKSPTPPGKCNPLAYIFTSGVEVGASMCDPRVEQSPRLGRKLESSSVNTCLKRW